MLCQLTLRNTFLTLFLYISHQTKTVFLCLWELITTLNITSTHPRSSWLHFTECNKCILLATSESLFLLLWYQVCQNWFFKPGLVFSGTLTAVSVSWLGICFGLYGLHWKTPKSNLVMQLRCQVLCIWFCQTDLKTEISVLLMCLSVLYFLQDIVGKEHVCSANLPCINKG